MQVDQSICVSGTKFKPLHVSSARSNHVFLFLFSCWNDTAFFRFITFQRVTRVILPQLIYYYVDNNDFQCCKIHHERNFSPINSLNPHNNPSKQGQRHHPQFPKEKLKLGEVSSLYQVTLAVWHQNPFSSPLVTPVIKLLFSCSPYNTKRTCLLQHAYQSL